MDKSSYQPLPGGLNNVAGVRGLDGLQPAVLLPGLHADPGALRLRLRRPLLDRGHLRAQLRRLLRPRGMHVPLGIQVTTDCKTWLAS